MHLSDLPAVRNARNSRISKGDHRDIISIITPVVSPFAKLASKLQSIRERAAGSRRIWCLSGSMSSRAGAKVCNSRNKPHTTRHSALPAYPFSELLNFSGSGCTGYTLCRHHSAWCGALCSASQRYLSRRYNAISGPETWRQVGENRAHGVDVGEYAAISDLRSQISDLRSQISAGR